MLIITQDVSNCLLKYFFCFLLAYKIGWKVFSLLPSSPFFHFFLAISSPQQLKPTSNVRIKIQHEINMSLCFKSVLSKSYFLLILTDTQRFPSFSVQLNMLWQTQEKERNFRFALLLVCWNIYTTQILCWFK